MRERQAGWPNLHPEDYCHRCGTRNVWSWSVDNPLWNVAIGATSPILCPQCFTEAYQRATGTEGRCHWELCLSRPPSDSALVDEIEAILEGNPHASPAYVAMRIAMLVEDRAPST